MHADTQQQQPVHTTITLIACLFMKVITNVLHRKLVQKFKNFLELFPEYENKPIEKIIHNFHKYISVMSLIVFVYVKRR